MTDVWVVIDGDNNPAVNVFTSLEAAKEYSSKGWLPQVFQVKLDSMEPGDRLETPHDPPPPETEEEREERRKKKEELAKQGVVFGHSSETVGPSIIRIGGSPIFRGDDPARVRMGNLEILH